MSISGSKSVYLGARSNAQWEGRQLADRQAFRTFLNQTVAKKVTDSGSDFVSELNALATTGMATQFISQLIAARPTPEDWEVGEALAECALEEDSGLIVHWPWNSVCDRRTPRASLPGADLVGFCCDGPDAFLLFGEVKTSSDTSVPPNVMSGGGGMRWQLHANASRLDIQRTLLQWLQARCKNPPYKDLFQRAVSRYLGSSGKDIRIVGVLIRDTPPNERDLKVNAKGAFSSVKPPVKINLFAWYLPERIDQLPSMI